MKELISFNLWLGRGPCTIDKFTLGRVGIFGEGVFLSLVFPDIFFCRPIVHQGSRHLFSPPIFAGRFPTVSGPPPHFVGHWSWVFKKGPFLVAGTAFWSWSGFPWSTREASAEHTPLMGILGQREVQMTDWNSFFWFFPPGDVFFVTPLVVSKIFFPPFPKKLFPFKKTNFFSRAPRVIWVFGYLVEIRLIFGPSPPHLGEKGLSDWRIILSKKFLCMIFKHQHSKTKGCTKGGGFGVISKGEG